METCRSRASERSKRKLKVFSKFKRISTPIVSARKRGLPRALSPSLMSLKNKGRSHVLTNSKHKSIIWKKILRKNAQKQKRFYTRKWFKNGTILKAPKWRVLLWRALIPNLEWKIRASDLLIKVILTHNLMRGFILRTSKRPNSKM